MTYNLNTDRTAVVAPSIHWLPINAHTPRGVSMLLINRASGVLQKGQYNPDEKFFDHWFPNPTFKKD